VVQAPDLWKLHDLARLGTLDGPGVGRVLVEGEVRARLMVAGEVADEDAAQMLFAEDEHVIQTLMTDLLCGLGLTRVQLDSRLKRYHIDVSLE
jgi:hypothetical protein